MKQDEIIKKIYPVNHYKMKFIKLISSSFIVFLPAFLLFTYNLFVFKKRNPEFFNLNAYLLTTMFVFLGLMIFLTVVFAINVVTENPFFFFLVTPVIIWLLILDDKGYENQFLAIVGGLIYFEDLENADNYSNIDKIFAVRVVLFLFTIGFYLYFETEKIKSFLQLKR